MKIFLKNLYHRWGFIVELLTAKSFVLLVHHRNAKTGRRRNRVHGYVKHQRDMSSLLKEAAIVLEQADQSTDSLLNTLGIRRANE